MTSETGKTVLLVEDEAIIAMSEQRTLEKFGYRVRVVHSGEEAVTAVAADPAIDLILMDIDLGRGIDGTEAAARILKDRDLPVVFLSSHQEPDIVERTERITSYGYVVKHSSATVLDASIKMAFKLFAAKIRVEQKETELLKRNRYIESILDNMPIGFAANSIDDGVARYLNEKFTEIYGWPREVLTDVERFFASAYPGPAGLALKARVLEDMASGDPARMSWDDLEIVTCTGERRRISARNIPIPDQNLMVSTVWDTTAAHAAQEALRESEEQFRTLAALLPVGIYLTDLHGRCRYANPRWLRMAGLTMEEALGDGWKRGLHPDDREAVFAAWQKTVEAEGSWGLEYRFRAADGAVTWVQGLAAPQRDPQGRVVGYIGANIDISASRRTEEELRASEERMRAIVEGTPHLFFYIQDAEAGTVYVSPTIEKITGYPPDVWMKRRDWFITAAAINREARARTHAHLQGEGAGEPVRLEIRHAQGHPILLEAYEYPVLRDGLVIGLQGVAHDITGRVRAEEELRESEERYRALFDFSHDAILLTAPDGGILNANPAAEHMFGRSVEEIRRLGRAGIVDISDPRLPAALDERARTGRFAGELTFLRADGTRFPGEISSIMFRDSEGSALTSMVIRDVSSRKRAEEALQRSEGRYRLLFEASPDGIVIIEPATMRILEFNETAHRQLGYSREEFARLAIADIEVIENPEDIRAHIDRVQRDGRSDFETEHRTRSGEIRQVKVIAQCTEIEGHSLYHCIWRDVSERRRMEQALRESEERTHDILFSMADWVWEVDEKGAYTYSSEKGTNILGYSREEILGRTPFDFMPADEAKRIAPVFQGIAAAKENIRDLENWNVRKDGERVCLLTNGVPVLDAGGNLKGYRGVDKDITVHKRAEETLRNSLRFQQVLMEAVPSPVFFKDTELRYIGGNAAFERYSGMTRERFVGRSVHEIAPSDLAARYEKADRELLETKGVQVYESEVRHSDGTRRHVIFHKAVFTDAEGRPAGIIGVISDISERRRTELALRESEERFRSLYENSPLGLYRTSPEGRIHLANPTLVAMLGCASFAELASRNMGRDGFAASDTRTRFMERVEHDGSVSGLENVWKRRDGTTIVVRESARAVRDARGKTLFYDGIVEDVTEIKRTERLMETLYGISQAVHSSRDLPVLYRRIHGLIGDIVNADNFYIALLTDDGASLEFPYYLDEKDTDDAPIRADDPRSLTVEVLRARKPLLLDGEHLTERYETGQNRVWGSRPKCWLGIPLAARDKIIGVMAIQDYHNGRAYGPREVALLEATAGQIAIAIERKRAEDELRESVADFKGYFNIGTVGMAVTSPDKGWIEVNDCLCRMLGYSREELAGMTWSQLTHPEDLNADLGLFNEVMAGRRDAYELEKRFVHKDGQVIHTRLYVACQRNADGKVRHFLASLINISQSKQAEEALRQSEAAQSAALQMTKSGHWEYDVERDLFTFNDNFYRIFRTTAAAVGGYQMTSAEYARRFCHPEDMSMVAEETRKAMEASDPGFNRQIEHRILYANGQTGIISVRIFIIKDNRGRTVKTYGVNQDITELKWAESEIKRQLEEKNVLLKEVHHRIKNNFAAVAGLLSLQAQALDEPKAVAALQEAIGRVDSMRLLYDKLLLGDGYQDITVKGYVESLATAVIGQFPGQVKVELGLDIADFALPPKQLFPLGIIINELLTNIMKHAFAGKKSGRIGLSLSRADSRVTLTLQDNGVGVPAEFAAGKSQGFGLMLVGMLSKQLGGTFTMKGGKKGTKSEIAFAVNK